MKYIYSDAFVFCSEGEDQVWYYSTEIQIDEVMLVLDQDHWERSLVYALNDLMEEIKRHMVTTEEITNEHRGNKKTALEVEVGKGFPV